MDMEKFIFTLQIKYKCDDFESIFDMKVGYWYVHFASLFYTIIYLYLSIYFIIWCNTYVILSYSPCLAIIGDASAGAGNQLETYLSIYRFRKLRKFQKNLKVNITKNKSRSWKGGMEASSQGQARPAAAGPPLAAGGARPWPMWPLSGSPSAYYWPLT